MCIFIEGGYEFDSILFKASGKINAFDEKNSPYSAYLYFENGKMVERSSFWTNSSSTETPITTTSPNDDTNTTTQTTSTIEHAPERILPDKVNEPTDNNSTSINGLEFKLSYNGWNLTKCENKNIKILTLPNSIYGIPITRIESSAFKDCKNLVEVTLPYTLELIGWADDFYFGETGDFDDDLSHGAFENCTKLQKVKIRDCKEIYDQYFQTIMSVMDYDIELKKGFFTGEYDKFGNKQYIILSRCEIGVYTFKGCSSLTDVQLANSVYAISGGTFEDCISLENIRIPDNVTTLYGIYNVNSGIFKGCTNLKSVKLSQNADRGATEYMFSDCTNLESIEVYCKQVGPFTPSGIDIYAFSDCKNLKSISIPLTCNFIGFHAFSSCDSLKDIYYEGNEQQWI